LTSHKNYRPTKETSTAARPWGRAGSFFGSNLTPRPAGFAKNCST